MNSSKAPEGAANKAGGAMAQPVVPTPTSTGDTLASVKDRYQPYSVGLVQADDPRLEGIDVDKLLGKEPVKSVSNEARIEFENLPKDPRRVLYYYDEAVAMKEPLLKVLPHTQRYKLTYELLKAYGMINNICMQVAEPKLLPIAQMTKFHSDKYIGRLRELAINAGKPSVVPKRERQRFNLNTSPSSMVKSDTLETCQLVCGASIEAARLVAKGRADVAINWMGGMQLAKRDESCGGNFVNDSVLVCLELLEKFDRILYVNFSYHHCEAVEEAFYSSSRIATLSMHSDTMQTGQVSDNGVGTGKKYHLNIPFARGVTDDLYFKSFESSMEEIRKNFEPQVVVCVVDPSVLGGDANGDFNLSSRCFVKCMKVFKDLVYNRNKVPCILLGGKSPDYPPASSLFPIFLRINTGLFCA